jgi:hypothetical protein
VFVDMAQVRLAGSNAINNTADTSDICQEADLKLLVRQSALLLAAAEARTHNQQTGVCRLAVCRRPLRMAMSTWATAPVWSSRHSQTDAT